MLSTRSVWFLPPRRHAAPHLLIRDCQNYLIWMSSTIREIPFPVSCCQMRGVLANPPHAAEIRLVSYYVGLTLNMVEGLLHRASHGNSGARAASVSSPLELARKRPSIMISVFCSWSAFRKVKDREVDKEDDKAKCVTFSEERIPRRWSRSVPELCGGESGGQQIFFARTEAPPTDLPTSNAWKRVRGDTCHPPRAVSCWRSYLSTASAGHWTGGSQNREERCCSAPTTASIR